MKRAHLVVKATLLIQEVEELGVGLSSPKVEVTDLEVAPDCAACNVAAVRSTKDRPEGRSWRTMAHVVRVSVVLGQEAQGVIVRDVLRVLGHELLRCVPECRNRLPILRQCDGEACPTACYSAFQRRGARCHAP